MICISVSQHRCAHRCICMQDAHKAVFLSNGIFFLAFTEGSSCAYDMHASGSSFSVKQLSLSLLLPKNLHVNYLIFLMLDCCCFCGTHTNVASYQEIPQMKKKAFPLPPWSDLVVAAVIPKFSPPVPAAVSPLRKRSNRQPTGRQAFPDILKLQLTVFSTNPHHTAAQAGAVAYTSNVTLKRG